MRTRRKSTDGFTLIELMVIVAILGIIASTAIPAFIKYMRRASTVEATMNLRRLYDASAAYFVSEHSDSNGTPVSRQFPGNAGPTPAAVPAGVRLLVPPADWKTPQWAALQFAVSDPLRYAYSFTSNGQTGVNAFATMMAQGDLDGDGIPSTFARTAQGSTEGVQGGSALYMVNEVE